MRVPRAVKEALKQYFSQTRNPISDAIDNSETYLDLHHAVVDHTVFVVVSIEDVLAYADLITSENADAVSDIYDDLVDIDYKTNSPNHRTSYDLLYLMAFGKWYNDNLVSKIGSEENIDLLEL